MGPSSSIGPCVGTGTQSSSAQQEQQGRVEFLPSSSAEENNNGSTSTYAVHNTILNNNKSENLLETTSSIIRQGNELEPECVALLTSLETLEDRATTTRRKILSSSSLSPTYADGLQAGQLIVVNPTAEKSGMRGEEEENRGWEHNAN